MKVLRKIIKVDDELCDGCGNCIPSCAEGALEIVDGKARVIADFYCDGLGACLGECPTGALSIVEREADEFDEEAVEEHLAKKSVEKPRALPTVSGGCPSAKLQTFAPNEAARAFSNAKPAAFEQSESELSHWPVQIMLVPPSAPFLKNADLLVVADCVPVTYPDFHRDFLKGKAVMMGCPKFDDAQHYIEKFAEICKVSGIKSITNVVMEVPCCSALPMIVKKGMQLSGATIPMVEVVISTRGIVLERRTVQAA
ncbi:MAG: 4Fe-4S dicluster domain-containing protein [Desulfobacterales bacterium]|jgi:Fe-S-cluster-containing hydrogenase component 2